MVRQHIYILSVLSFSVAQLCPPLWDCKEVHWISDAIQSSVIPFSTCPWSFPLALNLSQHQGLFQWISCLYQVAKTLELQHQSFQWIFRADFFLNWLVWSPCCPRDSQKSFPAPQFESINSWVLSLFYGPTLTSIHDIHLYIALTIWTFVGKLISLLF